jgi:hypothetical protein
MANLLFYEQPAVLSAKTHLNLRIKPSEEGLKFSGRTNSVLLAGVEFPAAARHYPIVFAATPNNGVSPLAVSAFANARISSSIRADAGQGSTSPLTSADIRSCWQRRKVARI